MSRSNFDGVLTFPFRVVTKIYLCLKVSAHYEAIGTTEYDYKTLIAIYCKRMNGWDRICGLVVRVLGYRSEARVRFPALPEKSSGSGTGSTTEELLDRKVAAPV
jgi:hypothetical protein